MNAVFSYDPKTERFGMQFEGETYFFTYDRQNAAVKSVWNESGKLIARSYKGLRTKLGIQSGSRKAGMLLETVMQAGKVKIN